MKAQIQGFQTIPIFDFGWRLPFIVDDSELLLVESGPRWMVAHLQLFVPSARRGAFHLLAVHQFSSGGYSCMNRGHSRRP